MNSKFQIQHSKLLLERYNQEFPGGDSVSLGELIWNLESGI